MSVKMSCIKYEHKSASLGASLSSLARGTSKTRRAFACAAETLEEGLLPKHIRNHDGKASVGNTKTANFGNNFELFGSLFVFIGTD